MTDLLAQYLETAALHAAVWGFALIFLFMTIESSFIPFPSEVVMIPAGFLAARGGLSFGSPGLDLMVAVLAGTAGSLAGATLNYYLAAYVGAPFLERYGKYVLLSPSKVQRAEEIFLRYGAGATFVCRLLPAIRQLISIPAGLSGMRFGSFALWTGLGAGLWTMILGLIGYQIGVHTAEMSYLEIVHTGRRQISENLALIVVLCVLAFAAYVWISNRVMRSQTPKGSPVES